MGNKGKEPAGDPTQNEPESKRRRVQPQIQARHSDEGPAPRSDESSRLRRRTRQYTQGIAQEVVGPTMQNLSILFHIIEILGFVFVPSQRTRMHGAMSLGNPDDWLHRIYLGLKLALVCKTWYVAVMGKGLLTTAHLEALGFGNEWKIYGDELGFGNVPSGSKVWAMKHSLWQRNLGDGLMPVRYLQQGHRQLMIYRMGWEHVPYTALRLLPFRWNDLTDCHYPDLSELWITRIMRALDEVSDDYNLASELAKNHYLASLGGTDEMIQASLAIFNSAVHAYEAAIRLKLDVYRFAFRVFGGYVSGLIFTISGAHKRSVEDQEILKDGLARLSLDFRNMGYANPMFSAWIQTALNLVLEYATRLLRQTQHAVYRDMQRCLKALHPDHIHDRSTSAAMEEDNVPGTGIPRRHAALFPDFYRHPRFVRYNHTTTMVGDNWLNTQVQAWPDVIPYYSLWQHAWRFDMIDELIHYATVVAHAGRLCAFNDVAIDRTGFHNMISLDEATARWHETQEDVVLRAADAALDTDPPEEEDKRKT